MLPRQRQRRLTADETTQIIAAYAAGSTMSEIASQLQVHRTTVRAQLIRAGIDLRSVGIPEQERDQMVRLYAEGWSCRRLGARFDRDGEAVRQVLILRGVVLRKPWER